MSNPIQLNGSSSLVANEEGMVLYASNCFDVSISLKENNHSTICLIHESDKSIDMNLSIDVAANSHLTLALLSLRNTDYNANFTINLNGSNSDVIVRSGLLGNANKQMSMQINHNAPLTQSSMEHYGLMTSDQPFTINGIGKVTKGCYGCDCRQALRAATFNDNKAITLTPILLIDEYDCQAAHATSIGQISPRQMYYLQAKGLSRECIMTLIAKGYMQPVVDCVQQDDIKEIITTKLSEVEFLHD